MVVKKTGTMFNAFAPTVQQVCFLIHVEYEPIHSSFSNYML